MKQIIKTVGQIMEDLRVFTNWNFAGGMKGDTCIINAPLVNEQGKKVDVTLEFYKTDVLIKVTAWNDCFDREKVEQAVGRLEISVETELNEASFILSHHEPLGVLEHSVKGVLKQCIIPMVDVAAELVAE